MDGFPYEVPEEYQSMPLLKGRATVDMKVKVKDNPNVDECVFRIVLDGYNAPVTAGNFVDLVQRHFYDGMEIQRGTEVCVISAVGIFLCFSLCFSHYGYCRFKWFTSCLKTKDSAQSCKCSFLCT